MSEKFSSGTKIPQANRKWWPLHISAIYLTEPFGHWQSIHYQNERTIMYITDWWILLIQYCFTSHTNIYYINMKAYAYITLRNVEPLSREESPFTIPAITRWRAISSDWLIDYIVFYAVLAIFRLCNGGISSDLRPFRQARGTEVPL